jgi:hypothetical protein
MQMTLPMTGFSILMTNRQPRRAEQHLAVNDCILNGVI